jgi:hypothetical protein
MIQFLCDTCAAVKEPHDVWLLGMAAEAVGTRAARREVSILPVWDRERAVQPLAVHFCSLQCKDNYMAALFSGDETREATMVVERTIPVETVIEKTSTAERRRPRMKRVVTKARSRHTKRQKN